MSKETNLRRWQSMLNRCNDSKQHNYKWYGARDIKVCKEWTTSFEAFDSYIGEPPSSEYTLDRIDNNGNYEPGNVRWATKTQQVIHTRLSKVNKTGYKGVRFKKDKKTKPYRVEVSVDNKIYDFGGYSNPIEAAVQYDNVAYQLHGEFAYLNFPNPTCSYH